MEPVVVRIIVNDAGNPPGRLADAELHFTSGPLEGLKLVGFGIWQREPGAKPHVTLPSRRYTAEGALRSFALLRPVSDRGTSDRVRDMLLEAYAEHEKQATGPVS